MGKKKSNSKNSFTAKEEKKQIKKETVPPVITTPTPTTTTNSVISNNSTDPFEKNLEVYDFTNTSPFFEQFYRLFEDGLVEFSTYPFEQARQFLLSNQMLIISIGVLHIGILLYLSKSYPNYAESGLKENLIYKCLHYGFRCGMIMLGIIFSLIILEWARLRREIKRYCKYALNEDLKDITGHYFKKGGKFWALLIKNPTLNNEPEKTPSKIAEPSPQTHILLGAIALDCKDHKTGLYELRRCTVDPRFRRYKIGSKLVQLLITEARKLGAKKIFLGTTNYQVPAIRLYEKFGFKYVSKKHLFWRLYENTMELNL